MAKIIQLHPEKRLQPSPEDKVNQLVKWISEMTQIIQQIEHSLENTPSHVPKNLNR